MKDVPALRIRPCNETAVNEDGAYVLYWMIANRRIRRNFSLQRAVKLAAGLNKPLIIFEALRCGYRWASDRLHLFIIQGMKDNAERLRDGPCSYYPYLEPRENDGKGLLAALAEQACVVVTDDFPEFFLPRMMRAAAKQVKVGLEAVDSNGLLPMAAADRIFPTAYSFRRFLQKNLPDHLSEFPPADPTADADLPSRASIPSDIAEKWPPADVTSLAEDPDSLSDFPIDHKVRPAAFRGGSEAANAALERFIAENLHQYADRSNQPDDDVTSGLSPYLHFGHISAHDVFASIARKEGWSKNDLSDETKGKRSGWWGMSESAEQFLDELITWRELAYNMCSRTDEYGAYESLPEWARETIEDHLEDPRPYIYSDEEFESSRTHDDLWNAAQRQLVREGRMHNYLRMLWGKKIFHWTESPQDALRIMIHLNNKYGVDGRNPNSYSGIFWILGRYDRPWGPEREVFGKIRYMTSKSAARKLRVNEYLERYGP